MYPTNPNSGYHPDATYFRRWMTFIDGENLTIRAQQVAENNNVVFTPGPYYLQDTFVWFPGASAVFDRGSSGTGVVGVTVQQRAIRSHYYTSVVGDEEKIRQTRQALRDLDFQPEVFKKARRSTKAKGVDVALTKDLLSNAFRDNYDIAVLFAGDGDYVPLVEEAQRLGKMVWLAFFANCGLNENLRLAADGFTDLEELLLSTWLRRSSAKLPYPRG